MKNKYQQDKKLTDRTITFNEDEIETLRLAMDYAITYCSVADRLEKIKKLDIKINKAETAE